MGSPAATAERSAQAGSAGWPWHRLSRRIVHRLLDRLRQGTLIVREGDRTDRFGQPGGDGLQATITVQHPAFYTASLSGGSIGAGEAYMRGLWSCDDLTAVVRILSRNAAVLEELRSGFGRLTAPLHRIRHALRRNTRPGSRRNIAAHYDLSDEFFALFLDRTMTYSCGWFDSPAATLEQAQIAKLDRICRKLALRRGDHVLEIGSGWGGFALHAAREYGCRVTTATISRRQFDWTGKMAAAAGLSDRITVVLKDYRDLQGRYDKLVSIEMIEAVGHEYYDSFFRICAELLKPQGAMLVQAIVIRDDLYEKAARTVDFIKRHIFPGGCLPSQTAIRESLERVTDLRVAAVEDMTAHYPATLRIWRRNLMDRADRVRALGFAESFLRMWEFYFCYCEGGFSERRIGNLQILLAKPGWRKMEGPA